MTSFLIVLSVVIIIGLSSLSQATMGVGLIALACLFGIYARMVQVSAQHKVTQGSAGKSIGA